MGTKWLQHSFIYELANNLVRSSEHLCHMSVSKPCTILDLANEYDAKEWKKNLKISFALKMDGCLAHPLPMMMMMMMKVSHQS